jgi:hypothetical protein
LNVSYEFNESSGKSYTRYEYCVSTVDPLGCTQILIFAGELEALFVARMDIRYWLSLVNIVVDVFADGVDIPSLTSPIL